MIIHNFDLNVIPDSDPVIVHVDQYDEGTGCLVAHLYNNDVSYSATGTAMIQGTKPDGKGFQYDATLSGNTVTANLTKQMTACAGRVRTQIVVTESSGRTGTFVFILDVQKSALPSDTDMSASEYQLISQVLDNVEAVGQEAISDINDAIDGAEANLDSKVSAAAASAAAAAQSASEAEQYAEGGLIYKGSILFANIPTTDLKAGNMYNMEEDFTTDSRFQEGAGISVKAGTNIAWNGSKWDLLAVGTAGHKIVNSSGTVMTARSKLKFANSTLTDDSANDTTIVTPQGSQISLPLSIDNGGTGATSASSARSNLGLGSLATKSSVSLTSNVTGTLPIGNGGTGNTVGYIRTGQKSGTTIGVKATAEGYDTTASGDFSHAEGRETSATANYGHAEGYQSNVSKHSSHAEGNKTTASGEISHAEGARTTASGTYSHSEGNETTASGEASHAEGAFSVASGQSSHAEGGGGCIASGRCSHAEGLNTIAGYTCNHAQGHRNKDMESGSSSGTDGNAMVIGNGTDFAKSNAFRVTFAGQVYGLSAFNSSGADYAEFFEWKDGNSNNEDRVGYFVTLDGEKIKIANKDDYILGVISGQPSVIGNGDEDWLGRWQRDDFGRFIWGDIETENSEGEKETIHTILPNPDYDSTQKYIERKDRKEWDYVGMLGNIAVRDDGTCEVNGFCTVADGGVATKAKTGYRVIKRVSDNVVKIILK